LPRDPSAHAAARITDYVCDALYEAVTLGIGETKACGGTSGALADTFVRPPTPERRDCFARAGSQ